MKPQEWAWEFLRRNPAYRETWTEAERRASEIRNGVSLDEMLSAGLNYQKHNYESACGILAWGYSHNDRRATIFEESGRNPAVSQGNGQALGIATFARPERI